MSKTFLDNTEPVELSYRGFVVTLTTDQPYWGLWLNRGGWPANNAEPFGCLGVEATNAPGEQPAGRWLGRGETFSGQVRLDVQAGISP